MKKEVFAAGVLLLLAAFSLWNQTQLKALSTRLEELFSHSCALSAAGEWDGALSLAREGEAVWQRAGRYVKAMLPHTESDAVTDAMCDYLAELCRQDGGGAEGMYRKLSWHLKGLYELEELSLESIF